MHLRSIQQSLLSRVRKIRSCKNTIKLTINFDKETLKCNPGQTFKPKQFYSFGMTLARHKPRDKKTPRLHWQAEIDD